MMKKYAVDFLCAFIITAVVFACLGLLTSEEFFNDAVVWDETEKTLQLFGTKFGLDEKSLFRTEKLFDFNDVLFGRGFSDAARAAATFVFDYVRDVIRLLLTAGRKLVGAV